MALPAVLAFLVIATPSGDIELTSLECGNGYTALAPNGVYCYIQQEGRVIIPDLKLNLPASSTELLVGRCSATIGRYVFSPRHPRFRDSAAGEELPATASPQEYGVIPLPCKGSPVLPEIEQELPRRSLGG